MFRNPFRKVAEDGLEEWLTSPRGRIRRQSVPPGEAFARWQAHRDIFDRTGLWPVIVPTEYAHNLEQIFADQAESVEDDIAMGLNLDVRDFFSGALEGQFEDEEYEMDLDFDPAGLVCEPKPPAARQVAALDVVPGTTRPPASVWIALLPCREPWEVPAVLGYGGWNGCPMPAEHVAVFREWYARHGAEPLVMGSDTVELLVRPIEESAEAKRVAIEQYAYCSDIVDQGVGTVEALASGLLDASVWFFWWD